MTLRVAKENAAFLYRLLEAYEGVVNYTTLTTDKTLGYRDIGLAAPPGLHKELQQMLSAISSAVPFEVISKN